MTNKTMTVVQCWDDGVTTDVRLTDIFRQYGAKATFNLNAGLYEKERKPASSISGDIPTNSYPNPCGKISKK